MKSMKERLDQQEDLEDEIKDLQVERVSMKQRLANLEGENFNLHTNIESVTKRLNELEKAQPVAIETARESMKTLLDQKVTDIISECRSSQKKCEEENFALKEDVAKLQRQIEDASVTTSRTVQKLCRYLQVVHSETQALKGKQPLNQPSLATRPPQFPTQREPGNENTDRLRDPVKRGQAAAGSGNAAAKKARIEKAAKSKYVLFKKGY